MRCEDALGACSCVAEGTWEEGRWNAVCHVSPAPLPAFLDEDSSPSLPGVSGVTRPDCGCCRKFKSARTFITINCPAFFSIFVQTSPLQFLPFLSKTIQPTYPCDCPFSHFNFHFSSSSCLQSGKSLSTLSHTRLHVPIAVIVPRTTRNVATVAESPSPALRAGSRPRRVVPAEAVGPRIRDLPRLGRLWLCWNDCLALQLWWQVRGFCEYYRTAASIEHFDNLRGCVLH